MNDVGIRIRNRREQLGMTQEELAIKVGYKSRASINKLELERDIPVKKLKPIADALEIEVSALMGWEDAEHSEDNAELLADVMHNQKLVQHIKKVIKLDDKNKEILYSYTDFLISTQKDDQ